MENKKYIWYYVDVIKNNKTGKIVFDTQPTVKVSTRSKKRKVFKIGEVAMVNVDGFHFTGMFAGYNTASNRQAWIKFPMANKGWTTLLCVKAKNAPHWNPI